MLCGEPWGFGTLSFLSAENSIGGSDGAPLGLRWLDELGRRGICLERDCGRGPCSPNAERTGSGSGT